jgi:hypothetical protein
MVRFKEVGEALRSHNSNKVGTNNLTFVLVMRYRLSLHKRGALRRIRTMGTSYNNGSTQGEAPSVHA